MNAGVLSGCVSSDESAATWLQLDQELIQYAPSSAECKPFPLEYGMSDLLTGDFLQQLLPRVEAACVAAGEAILKVYHSQQGFSIETKADHSPVTDADFAAHNHLEPALTALLADTPVLSEESDIPSYAERRQWQRYWLVDPLDGTKEFISGSGEFTVNVALIEAGEPVLGVVHVPVTKTTYSGIRGVGASKSTDQQRHSITSRALPITSSEQQEAVTLALSRRHRGEALEPLLKQLEEELGPLDTQAVGSSLKFCMVAEGKADLYPRLGPTSEWDTAAAQAIVEAAGGAVVDREFRPLRYNTKEGLINPDFFVVGDPSYRWRSLLALTAS